MTVARFEPGADQGTAGAPPVKEKGFWALNWLRFILAIYIVLFHTLKNYGAIQHTWFEATLGLGNMATSGFFVLSGFLLTYAYVVQKNGRALDKRNFWIARFSTLYPLHIAGLLLALLPMTYTIVVRGGIDVPVDVEGTVTRTLGHLELLLAFVMNATLTNAWNPYYLSFNYPSWSLSALGCYYLLFPFIALKIYRMKRPVTALVVLGLLFLLPGAVADFFHMTDVVTDGVLHHNPIVRLPLFIAGMVLCVLFARSTVLGSRRQVVLLTTVLLATAAVGVDLQFAESRLHLIRNGLYYPASLAIIWLCACVPQTDNRMIKYWGARLGAASLPLFLLHGPLFPLFRAFEKFVKAVVYSPELSFRAIVATGRTIEQTTTFYLVYLVALVVVCVLVQERLVAPLQVKIRNYMSHRQTAALVAKNSRSSAG